MAQRNYSSASKSEIALANKIEELRKTIADKDAQIDLLLKHMTQKSDRGRSVPAWLAPKQVLFYDKATIVYWKDGTKTVVECDEEDEYSKEKGFFYCYLKKIAGNRSTGLYELLKPLDDPDNIRHEKSSTKRKKQKREAKAKAEKLKSSKAD